MLNGQRNTPRRPWSTFSTGRDTNILGIGRAPASALCSIKFWHFLIEFRCTSSRHNSNKSQQTKNQITTKLSEQWNFPHTYSHSAHIDGRNLALASVQHGTQLVCHIEHIPDQRVGANFITSLNNCAPKCSIDRRATPSWSLPEKLFANWQKTTLTSMWIRLRMRMSMTVWRCGS